MVFSVIAVVGMMVFAVLAETRPHAVTNVSALAVTVAAALALPIAVFTSYVVLQWAAAFMVGVSCAAIVETHRRTRP